jgi:hypothetical protein
VTTSIRWGRTLLLGASAFALAMGVALFPVVYRLYLERKAAEILPSIASRSELESILVAVLEQTDFQGVPEPAPEPGQVPRPHARRGVVLVNETIEICNASTAPKCGPTESSELFLYPGLDARIPRQFRRELVAANVTSVTFDCPRLNWAQCEGAAAISSIFTNGGWWDDFYGKYPNTAGVVRISNAVLSHDGASALLYVTHGCDGLCGTGSLVLLQKTEGTWVIQRREQLWIS